MLLLRGEHRVPCRKENRLLLEQLEDILWNILALHYKAEHILVEPLVGHNEVALVARLYAPAVLYHPFARFAIFVDVYSNKGTLDLANLDYESLFRTSFPMNKKERVMTYASGSSHAMTLIAVDLDNEGKPRKWMVENSWGIKSGYKGNLIMTDEWFNEYMFRLVVERKYVPQDILEMLKQKPTMLPAWDPMFAPEE